MKYKNLEIHAKPYFRDVTCPKHGIVMFQFEDGWINVAFFCPKCKAPYEVAPVKMKKWNKKALQKALADMPHKPLI